MNWYKYDLIKIGLCNNNKHIYNNIIEGVAAVSRVFYWEKNLSNLRLGKLLYLSSQLNQRIRLISMKLIRINPIQWDAWVYYYDVRYKYV